ncbi:MAG TPA: hypothetical protein VGR55_18855 [Candidatus Acidoferrum sp.]|nr:hypothetical protein [Candidatus Acidoferrum sp.]
MNFESLAKTVSSKVADLGAQKATETLDQANLLLKLLQDAGYQVGEVDVELGVPPAISVTLKTGPMLTDAKLDSIFEANKGNDALALVLGGLIQANKLRDKVKLETIELKDTKIVLKATPSISLHWKERAAATAAGAS